MNSVQKMGIFSRSKPGNLKKPDCSLSLPSELWLLVARWLDEATVQKLATLNRTFYSLSLDVKYRHVVIDTCHDRFKAFGELQKLFKKLRSTHPEENNIGGRVRSIWASDDIFHGTLPHMKPVYNRGLFKVSEVRSRRGIWRRTHTLMREARLILTLFRYPKTFAQCRNVETLELVMRGPWFSKKDTLGWGSYTPEFWIVHVFELLCTAFKENLSELRLTMFNAEHLSDCLITIPPLHQFPNLKILDLNFSRVFGNYEYSTDDFRVFIAHFRDTLCVLRLKFMNLGEDPLKLFLAQHQNIFPCLSTLDLHYTMNSNAPYRKGYPHLTNFLAQCPVLRRLVLRESGHIVLGGNANDNQEQFDLPEDLPLSELVFDDWSWATHHLSLNKLLGGEKSQIHVLDCTSRTSSDFVEDVYRSVGPGFCRHLTNLTLKIVRFYVHDFVHQVNELHSLEVLVVTCKYLAFRYSQYTPMYPPSVIPISDSKSELSETSSSTTISTSETKHSRYTTAKPKYISTGPEPVVVFEHSNISSMDVIRHPLPYGHLEGDSYNTGCTACPEVRLWDVLKFYATSFPSIRIFGDDTRREEVFDYKQASLYCEQCQNVGYWLVDEVF